MLQSLEWRHALDGIPLKALIQKVNELLVSTLKDVFDALSIWLPSLSARVRLQLGLTIRLEEDLGSSADGEQGLGWHTIKLHNICELLVLTFTWKKWEATEHFRNDGTERPHVNSCGVWYAEDDLWRPVESTLDVRIDALAHEARAAIVYQLQSRLVLLLEQNVLRLQVTVHEVVVRLELQRLQNLDCEPPYKVLGNTLEVVLFEEIV